MQRVPHFLLLILFHELLDFSSTQRPNRGTENAFKKLSPRNLAEDQRPDLDPAQNQEILEPRGKAEDAVPAPAVPPKLPTDRRPAEERLML